MRGHRFSMRLLTFLIIAMLNLVFQGCSSDDSFRAFDGLANYNSNSQTEPEPEDQNTPPVIEGETTYEIKLPESTAQIFTSVTDPDGQIIGLIWNQLAGPNIAIMDNVESEVLEVSGLIEGLYEFEILALDNLEAISVFTVLLTVHPADPPPEISYQDLFTNIFSPRCLACHSDSNSQGGYSMSTHAGSVQKVTPGNPGVSTLYTEVLNGDMPQGSDPLSAEEIEQIRLWIEQGARDN